MVTRNLSRIGPAEAAFCRLGAWQLWLPEESASEELQCQEQSASQTLILVLPAAQEAGLKLLPFYRRAPGDTMSDDLNLGLARGSVKLKCLQVGVR